MVEVDGCYEQGFYIQAQREEGAGGKSLGPGAKYFLIVITILILKEFKNPHIIMYLHPSFQIKLRLLASPKQFELIQVLW